jgi:hypothetical protein
MTVFEREFVTYLCVLSCLSSGERGKNCVTAVWEDNKKIRLEMINFIKRFVVYL